MSNRDYKENQDKEFSNCYGSGKYCVFRGNMDESEKSEEQDEITNIISKFVVEINEVRCTVLYPGETLSSISQKYDIPKTKLLEFNEISNDSDLKEGDFIYLSKKKNKYTGIQDYYRVKKEDTLYSIAQQFGIKMASLAKLNNKDFFSSLKELFTPGVYQVIIKLFHLFILIIACISEFFAFYYYQKYINHY
mgnify:CR=1 FL=1